MSFILKMPNEHELNFFKYFGDTVDEVLCPFYVIPCRYSGIEEGLVADSEIVSMFRQDNKYINNPNETFFEKIKGSNLNIFNMSNYELIEQMMNDKGYNDNLRDVVVGYYDKIEETFVQIAYIPDFYSKKLYGILDYAYNETVTNFFRSEDMLDIRAIQNTKTMKTHFGVEMNENDILYIIEELKKVCIEGSFYGSYKKDIIGMNYSISETIQEALHKRKITRGINVQTEMNVISYLKTLGVLEMYITPDERNFTSISFIKEGDKINKKEQELTMFLGFHPSFLDMLDDKYS